MAAIGRPSKKLSLKLAVEEQPADLFCVRFSEDNQLVAAGCGDGVTRVYTLTGRLAFNLNADKAHGTFPVTCLRFRPNLGGSSRARNMVIAASSDGSVRHWHLSTQKCLHTIVEEGNEVYALDYAPDASAFATAGRDHTIRLYDEATKEIKSKMEGAGDGHSNRVFSLKFKADDPDIVLSGGWDNTVQIWDARVGSVVRSIYGPHVCGDAIDLAGDKILTGSWREEDQLQLWDYGSGELLDTLPWSADDEAPPCFIYAAQFSADGRFVAAGGSGANEAKVFVTDTHQVIGHVDSMEKGVFSIAFSPNDQYVGIGSGDNALRVMELKDTVSRPPVASTY
ncbi:uncharacterized protein AMSG_04458 [Thecamonas trahens ATCC 50062]|uniref:Uncharacterized protein n=1 Tax=Thecamonas trahens ATCC 50062 TaxID=461836 RepID=A0A0L0DAA5_THETB|nr:hypothetical protein AMSG_04458 [Thecamonas trahens ATCC 50062]KNC48228.1 hypothetical protein AMSG_04458 [Thecamonas trahens ATCC 50062]|eukprot:XP_013758797.1 hypothetical protein AMSG_04458 [Thecamonas trahens ATCC 50062]